MSNSDSDQVHEENAVGVLMTFPNDGGPEESRSALPPLATQIDARVSSSQEGMLDESDEVLAETRSDGPVTDCFASFSLDSFGGTSFVRQHHAISMMHLTTFEGCPEFLRGTLLAKVLKHQGRILDSSSGSAATFGLSKVVLRLNAFISHNYAVPRWPKFLALTYYYNFKAAAVITFLVALIVAFATAAGVLPAFDSAVNSYPVGLCCTLLILPTFLFLFFFMRDYAGWLGYKGPTVFLDKTCIHQEDASIQRQGIEKLGAFLSSADEMVVLYSEVYLLRLWTVYEVASFLAVHPIRHMKVVSVKQAKLLLTAVASLSVTSMAERIIWTFTDRGFEARVLVAATLLGLGLVPSIRARAREKQDIHKRLLGFTVKDCVCSVESDRPIVYSNIADLMRAQGFVPEDASEKDALQAFDESARTNLPFAFASSMTRFTFSYTDNLLIGAFAFVPACLDRWAGLAHGVPMRVFAIDALNALFRILAIVPLTFALMECLGSRCLHWRGPREWLVVVFALVLGFAIPGAVLNMLSDHLMEYAFLSDAMLGVYVLVDVIGCVASVLIFLGPCRRRHSSSHNEADCN
mmetsp:Transcript_105393/g.337065  ORF Transcript_105393/g.337065 Transcript_105393/m.337065 type:complete len:578 (+) Transcript_105393:81-1814(+)